MKKNILAWCGVAFGIIGFGFALYSHYDNKYEKRPTFYVEPLRTEIINRDRISDTPIKVFTEAGREVTSDLTSVILYFWNAGKKPIKLSDIHEDIEIQIMDSNATIIDFAPLKRPLKEITKFRFVRDSLRHYPTIKVDFHLLEHNQGATYQVLYEGDPKAKILIEGYIEETNGHITNNSIIDNSPDYFSIIILCLLLAGCFYVVKQIAEKFEKKFENKSYYKYIKDVTAIILIISFFSLFIFIANLYFTYINPDIEDKIPQALQIIEKE